MHIPEFKLVDRIKTKTVLSGLSYLGGIGIQIMLRKLFGKNSMSLEKSDKKSIIDNFHILYEKSHKQTYDNTLWMGVNAMKCPLDLWIYQEILFEKQPDIIIETGTNKGGSSLFLASVCDLIKNGEIITIDFTMMENTPTHSRIHYLQGDSTAKSSIEKIKTLMEKINPNNDKKIMVILDDDHSKKHVLEEIEIYGKFVTPNQYLIVEDTSMGGHPVWPELVGGPMEAVNEYMTNHTEFEIDNSKEKFLLTFNPNGYLIKKS